MKINKLTATFGKFQNESISFHQGLNIINAPNESGKTTWCAFIMAMLYGIDSSERSKNGILPAKRKYEPWSGLPMEGRMDLTADKCDITLSRTTRLKNAPMREFSAFYSGTGIPVDGMTGLNAGEQLTGVSKDVFAKSAFIGQGASAVTNSPDMEKRIQSILSTGEEEVSVSEADARLGAWLRKRRYSHRRIQPKNRIPSIEPKKKLGKTSMKIIKPKKYDEDETDTELTDFDDKLLKFPRFKAKYGKNFVLKKINSKNKFINLTSYISNHSGKNIIDYKRPQMEKRMGDTKKTNLTISEVEEEEEKNYKKRKMPLNKVKPKNAKLNMNKKMREILGKQYKLLVNDPLNPYGTYWPSNFLKMGYDTGFEYDNFQSGVPVLKLRSLAKKPLPPVKKKGQGLHFNNDASGLLSPNKIGGKHPMFPNTAKKTIIHEEIGKEDKDMNIRVNKSQTIKPSNNNNE